MTLLAAFAGAMEAAALPPAIAVAVSGGADSMALVLLAQAWANQKKSRVIALTVDHGLRQEAAAEASQVARWCASRSIEHQTLTWRTSGKATQAAARDARYQLLADWCRDHNVLHLLTAHHRGDQAETLFFRLARGSTLRGLACIPSMSEMNGIRLIRPLLAVSKKELMQYLRDNDQPWIEDPSNLSPRYTRNTIRAALQSLPNAEEIEARAAQAAESFGRIRAALDQKTDAAFETTVHFDNDRAEIDADRFAALPPETALLLTGKLIQVLTGDGHPPRTEKLERLCRWLASPDSNRATLAHLEFTHLPERGTFRVSSSC